jgi:hypothetical protein
MLTANIWGFEKRRNEQAHQSQNEGMVEVDQINTKSLPKPWQSI